MPHRVRAIHVVVLVDKLDANGNVVEELQSSPVKLFPEKFGAIPSQAAELIAKLDAEEKASRGPVEFPCKKKP